MTKLTGAMENYNSRAWDKGLLVFTPIKELSTFFCRIEALKWKPYQIQQLGRLRKESKKNFERGAS
jgi:hypothetical protein